MIVIWRQFENKAVLYVRKMRQIKMDKNALKFDKQMMFPTKCFVLITNLKSELMINHFENRKFAN